jgi:hypothetical protein
LTAARLRQPAALNWAPRYSNILKPGLTIPSRRAMCGRVFIFKKTRRALRENILVGWKCRKAAIAQKRAPAPWFHGDRR